MPSIEFSLECYTCRCSVAATWLLSAAHKPTHFPCAWCAELCPCCQGDCGFMCMMPLWTRAHLPLHPPAWWPQCHPWISSTCRRAAPPATPLKDPELGQKSGTDLSWIFTNCFLVQIFRHFPSTACRHLSAGGFSLTICLLPCLLALSLGQICIGFQKLIIEAFKVLTKL